MEVAIPQQFDFAHPFHEGMAAVELRINGAKSTSRLDGHSLCATRLDAAQMSASCAESNWLRCQQRAGDKAGCQNSY